MPANAVGAGYVEGRATDAPPEGIPVHVKVLWSDGIVDTAQDGTAEAWTRDHVYVRGGGRGGQWWCWFHAEDVRRA
ncbi:hypothetical protein [Enterococcus hirae]|uniref:hypothetical protein n=1 Tax=Enterococcus hirae TaxID=1354 RepID=UPI00136D878A|nr:hypothetical protein [Enterococcus hirae]NAE18240.1 hypothetical protein [Enterococcus hirae]